jgi:hypothetical protein
MRTTIIDRKLGALGNFALALWKGWPLWITLLCVLVPYLLSELRKEDSILILGVGYQLIGLLSILFGINSKLAFANRLSLEMVRNWIKEVLYALRVLFIGHKPIYGNMSSTCGSDTSIGIGVMRGRVDYSKLPLEAQVTALWKEHYQLEDRLDKVDAIHRDSARNLERKIEEQKNDLVSKIRAEREELNRFLSEDYKYELAGVLVMTIGMIFSSLPKYVSRWYP